MGTASCRNQHLIPWQSLYVNSSRTKSVIYICVYIGNKHESYTNTHFPGYDMIYSPLPHSLDERYLSCRIIPNSGYKTVAMHHAGIQVFREVWIEVWERSALICQFMDLISISGIYHVEKTTQQECGYCINTIHLYPPICKMDHQT